ncbi:MAG: phage major capsid protein [Candidatus Anammoxibacter sp.]
MDPKTKEQEEVALLEKIKAQSATQIDDKMVEIKADYSKLIGEAKESQFTAEQFTDGLKPIEEKLKDYDPEIFGKYQETLDTMTKLQKQVDEQGIELAKQKEGGGLPVKSQSEALWEEVLEHVKSDKFEQFCKNTKQPVSFELKTVSITSDYTGTVFISQQDPTIVDTPEVTRLNIRDLLRVSPIDFPLLSFLTVTSWDRAVGVVTENGVLPESSFKEVEVSTDVKRIGTFISLSKRILRRPDFIVNHLRQRMPAQVRYYEDFQLLWGDGLGENLTGLFKQVDDFATIINATKIVGVATDVASVATYDGGAKALITFAISLDQLFNGDIITFANATEATYNASFSAIVISPTQIIIDLTFVTEADTSAWTFTVNNTFKDSITAAQQIDVLKVASSVVNVQQYRNTGFVLNPEDATKIELLKGTTNHYIDIGKLESGVLTIGGVPVVQTTAMPAGFFMCGDWSMAAALFQFTDLTLEFAESTAEKKTNTVVAIIQEEVLFPIYNKFMFIGGDFTSAISAIGV